MALIYSSEGGYTVVSGVAVGLSAFLGQDILVHAGAETVDTFVGSGTVTLYGTAIDTTFSGGNETIFAGAVDSGTTAFTADIAVSSGGESVNMTLSNSVEYVFGGLTIGATLEHSTASVLGTAVSPSARR
jgi:hypothetical protein